MIEEWQVWALALLERGQLILFEPWTLYQIGIIVGLYVACKLIARRVEPRLERWVRSLKVNSGLLRVLAALLRRVEWVLFVPAVYLAYVIAFETISSGFAEGAEFARFLVRQQVFPLLLAANLSATWLVINVLSRIIRSRLVARFVSYVLWGIVALNLTGYLAPTVGLLDSLGLTIGEVRITALAVIQGLALLIGLTWLASQTGNFVENRIQRVPELTPSLQVLIGKFVKIFLVVVAIAVALNSVGVDLTALTVFSGAVGVGLGFGLQKVVSNFVSGVIILLDKSIKPGDTISLGDTFGWIRELRSRFVSVVTRDGREFLIPNEDFITQEVINWSFTDKLVRLDVHFGVSYDSDPHKVTKIVIEAAKGVKRVNTTRNQPVCWLTGFGDSSLDFICRFWINDPQNGLTNIRGQVLIAIWDTFKEHGVGIPFPHREIIMRTPVEIGDVRGKPTFEDPTGEVLPEETVHEDANVTDRP